VFRSGTGDRALAVTRIAASDQPAVAMRIAAIEPQGVEELRSVRLESASETQPDFDFIPGQFLISNTVRRRLVFAIASAPGHAYYGYWSSERRSASQELFDLPVGLPVNRRLGRNFRSRVIRAAMCC
jgi:hypothetical protein